MPRIRRGLPPHVQKGSYMPKQIRPAKVVSIISRKGGEAKTTLAHHVAAAAALSGCEVLVIEADDNPRLHAILAGLIVNDDQELDDMATAYGLFANPQDGIGEPHHLYLDRLWESVPHLSLNQVQELRSQRRWSFAGKFDYLPGSERIKDVESEYARKAIKTVGFEPDVQFSQAISEARQRYDLIIIDSPPSLTTILRNILAASTQVIIPVSFDFAAIEDYQRTMKAFLKVRQALDAQHRPTPQMPYVVFNKFNARNPDHQEVLDAYLHDHIETVRGMDEQRPALITQPVLGIIPFEPDLINRAARHNRSLHQYAPKSEAGAAFYELWIKTALAFGLE